MSLDFNKTIAYYNQHAVEYFVETVQVDLQEQREVFLAALPPGGQIMDLGCGSGRDSRWFLSQGYAVDALDASEELCKLAQQHTGIAVQCWVYDDPRYEMLRLWRTQDGLGRETKWINFLVKNKE